MKKPYNSPELELRIIFSYEIISASSDGMTGDDNEFDVSDAWGNDW